MYNHIVRDKKAIKLIDSNGLQKRKDIPNTK